MNHEERITITVTLNLTLQWEGQTYLAIVMYTFMLKGTITVPKTAAQGVAVNNANKRVVFKNRALFTNCITKINNTQADDAQDIDKVIPMYNLKLLRYLFDDIRKFMAVK